MYRYIYLCRENITLTGLSRVKCIEIRLKRAYQKKASVKKKHIMTFCLTFISSLCPPNISSPIHRRSNGVFKRSWIKTICNLIFFAFQYIKNWTKVVPWTKFFCSWKKGFVSLKKTASEILWSEVWKGGFQFMLILDPKNVF